MRYDLPQCKITVLKRTLQQELVDEYLHDPAGFGRCENWHEGQEFILESPWTKPEGFCTSAWANIRHQVLAVAVGGDPPWMKRPGTMIAGCPDLFRQVIFEVERIE
jgi:uncharacterized repeat protein (TIGR04076 family)